ncbi:phosphopyruvate hydratase [Patescibacteria group bacterium]|nr:phosphopyruvate hydratase [Patescibacteria group bacterium]
MKIERVEARAIPDTRGKPTVEVTLHALCIPGMHKEATASEVGGHPVSTHASVPSGKSTGSHEACELRDADGGVETAVANVEGEIARALCARKWNSPDEIDGALIALDGTPNKSRLGANAILAVSIAAQRLFAQEANVPLWKAIAERAGTTPGAPRLYVNVMNGGVHADFRLPFQEYILVCEGRTSAAFAAARAAFDALGATLGNVPMGEEGGYSPTFETLQEPFELLAALVAEHAGTSIAIDAAANELLSEGAYRLLAETYAPDALMRLYEDLASRFPFHSIEDPFSEDAGADFARLTAALRGTCLVVGDDFTVTNPARIAHAAREEAISAVLIKPNQIGSVKEAIEAVEATHAAGWAAICSHRSGETDDTFIADFAYGVGAEGIKAGGLGQKQRLEKYERLLEIEKEAEAV